jgi:hypothetical protein
MRYYDSRRFGRVLLIGWMVKAMIYDPGMELVFVAEELNDRR